MTTLSYQLTISILLYRELPKANLVELEKGISEYIAISPY